MEQRLRFVRQIIYNELSLNDQRPRLLRFYPGFLYFFSQPEQGD